MSAKHTTRRIQPSDDPIVAHIIRTVMPEFGATGEGFAIVDPEVDGMHDAYRGPRAGYWVVEHDGRVVGGAGYAPLEGGEDGVCELRKMYFLPEARGHGLGAQLLREILDDAAQAGFHTCYIETLEHMHAARRLYEGFGFVELPGPMGATGHHGCDAWYARALT